MDPDVTVHADSTKTARKVSNKVDASPDPAPATATRRRNLCFHNAGICCARSSTALLSAAAILVLLVVVLLLTAIFYLFITSGPSKKCLCQQEPDLEVNIHDIVKQIRDDDVIIGHDSKAARALWNDIRLPRHVIPIAYRLELRVDAEKETFWGRTEIDVTVNDDVEFVVLHAVSLKFGQVSIEKIQHHTYEGRPEVMEIRRMTLLHDHEQLVLETTRPLKSGVRYKIRFSNYTGLVNEDMRGLYRSTYRDQNGRLRYVLATQFQSVDARRVFPCFDEPIMKAVFTLTIIHRPGYTALSNTRLVNNSTIENDDDSGRTRDWIREQFDQTPRMSTYLLAIVVCDFKHSEQTAVGGLKVRVWAREDVHEQTAHSLELAIKLYEFYTNYFQMSEVVSKADHAAIPDFSAGAMENWGLVLYREAALLHDENMSSASNKYWVSLVVAHEIAHTWFGNMATMAWWDDLWLNEGFANTLMYFALNHIYSSWNVFDLQMINCIFPVMTKDALLTSHAVSMSIQHPDDIALLYDSISYDKGMAILRLLRGFVGWNDFRKGLQNYVTKYKYSNANMSQLWSVFQEAVGNKYRISEIMDTWTRQMGFPVVSITHVTGSDRYVLNQSRFLVNPEDSFDPSESTYRYKWKIPFVYRIQGKNQTATEWLDMGSAEITVPDGSWLIGNVDYMGFYRTNYDVAMWQKITNQLKTNHKVFSAANRAGLINDAFNLARANLLSYDVAFGLTSYLLQEEDYVPWAAFFDATDFIDAMLSTSDVYGKWQKYIYGLIETQYKRLEKTKNTGSLLHKNLHSAILSAACSVQLPAAVNWARNAFSSWIENGTRVPSDYSFVVYAAGIQYGGEAEWDYVWNKAQSTLVVSEAETMMTALGRTQQPWLLWRYVRMSLDSSKVRMQDIRNLFRYYTATSLGRLVTLQFMLTNWSEMNTRFGGDAFLLRDVIVATLNYVNTEQDHSQLERLFRQQQPLGAANKTAAHSLAVVRSNINWMKLNYNAIANWLNSNDALKQQQQQV